MKAIKYTKEEAAELDALRLRHRDELSLHENKRNDANAFMVKYRKVGEPKPVYDKRTGITRLEQQKVFMGVYDNWTKIREQILLKHRVERRTWAGRIRYNRHHNIQAVA